MADFVPLQFPPGVIKSSSNALVQGNWTDTNLVRWETGGSLKPVGGWEQYSLPETASIIRAMHTWIDNSGIERTGVLCENHLYVLEGGVLTDVSPTTVPIEGPPSDLTVGGYGDDVYGDGTYGTARPTHQSLRLIGPAWTIANWGEDLVAMSSYDGRLLRWQPSAPLTLAAAVPNAPVACRTFIVTPERHVVVFQSNGTTNRFDWCDQEDIENWTVSPTTTAGFYEIQPFAPIVSAKVIKNGFVFFTTVGPYFSRYIGVPYIYSYDPVAGGSIPISQGALMEAGGRAYWIADDGVWSTDGLSVDPVPCTLHEWFRKTMNPIYVRYRMSGVNIGTYQEIWWFWPEGEGTENTRYSCYNFVDKWWAHGRLTRTCGASATFSSYPTFADAHGMYKHESGNFYHGAPELPYAESGAINSKSGAIMTYVDQMVVDHGGDRSLVNYTFKGYLTRQEQFTGVPAITIGPKQVRTDGYLDARLTARDIVFRIEMAADGVGPFTFGQPLINASPRGNR